MQTPETKLDETDASPASATRPRARAWYKHLSIQILFAMILGVTVGHAWPQHADSWKPLGDLFIKIVRMLVAPIIFCTVVHGIASVGEAKKVGRVAIKSLIYFEIVTTIALVLALVLVNFWAPGAGMHVDIKTLADIGVKALPKPITFGQFLLNLVPATAVGAFADGEVIPVLFFSLMFAFGLLALGAKGKPLVDTIHSVTQVLFKMIGFAMYLAPIGAFGAIAFTVGKFGLVSLLSLGKLVSEFYVCCLLFVAIVLTPIAFAAGINILRLIRYIAAELMIVVGTSSGESVFPSVMAKLRRLGIEESIVALVLPTGYSFNHDGTCLYWATASGFLAQAVGIHLSIGQQLALLATMLFTSKGGAGVAGSAIVILATTLSATGTIPVASIGLILGVHSLLSSAFVPVNVLGNSLATIVIARTERAVDLQTLQVQLKSGPDEI
ncbi:MAG TPA: cation:dicarboxylase symporter family transporter [Candidatus Saccharimonadales bacterium]|jgi:aerobic C4-dicarboxylate transport protein|nr:cation:dicarboxylase symporter family transporter [Candidatus Saccharimonadales bacterium]